MKDRYQINSCDSYFDNGNVKREILKANSSGRRESSHDSRSSFFTIIFPPQDLRRSQKHLPVVFCVAEPPEIPIFKIPLILKEQQDSYPKMVFKLPFFNST